MIWPLSCFLPPNYRLHHNFVPASIPLFIQTCKSEAFLRRVAHARDPTENAPHTVILYDFYTIKRGRRLASLRGRRLAS